VAWYCVGKRVLDLLCYTGGFALNAQKDGGAGASLGIDSSSPALAQANRNAERSRLADASFECGDVLKVLERLNVRASDSTSRSAIPPSLPDTKRI
jgi:23S rRNA (cytosine1962-C5)-methyltransferase